MRRAVLVLGGTVAGLAALFSFKSHMPGLAPVTLPSTPAGLSRTAPSVTSSSGSSPTAASSAGASPSTGATKKTTPKTSSSATTPATTAPTAGGGGTTPTTHPATTPTTAPASTAPSKKPTTPATTPAAPPTTAPAAKSGTFNGPTESTQYGNVQVTITVVNGKITNANGNLQGGDSTGQNAIPQLNSEVLQVQSANIQGVSGATFTSQGYIGSLQAAVNQAGL